MAAGQLNEPGSEYGPCAEACEHTDCAATRKMAERLCVHCNEPIGYGVSFYNVTPDDLPVWTRLAHMICELEAVTTKCGHPARERRNDGTHICRVCAQTVAP